MSNIVDIDRWVVVNHKGEYLNSQGMFRYSAKSAKIFASKGAAKNRVNAHNNQYRWDEEQQLYVDPSDEFCRVVTVTVKWSLEQ